MRDAAAAAVVAVGRSSKKSKTATRQPGPWRVFSTSDGTSPAASKKLSGAGGNSKPKPQLQWETFSGGGREVAVFFPPESMAARAMCGAALGALGGQGEGNTRASDGLHVTLAPMATLGPILTKAGVQLQERDWPSDCKGDIPKPILEDLADFEWELAVVKRTTLPWSSKCEKRECLPLQW
jgi:hypothetical protein